MTRTAFRRRVSPGQCLLVLLMLILTLIFLLPIVLTFSTSVSTPEGLLEHNAGLLPSGFTWQAYQTLLADPRLVRYYANTILYAVTGTGIMLFCTMTLAYTLIHPTFGGRRFINVLLVITMFFSGGMVPTYLLIKNLGMYNTIWAMVLPGAVSAWNVIVVKTFFKELPGSLLEAAFIDGAGHFTVLLRIILPLSRPIVATMSLFSVVGYWNDYFSAVMYLKNEEMYPIAMLLRKMLVLLDGAGVKGMVIRSGTSAVNSRTAKCAAVIITMIPIMMIYPFLQKHFAKGLLVGSVKG